MVKRFLIVAAALAVSVVGLAAPASASPAHHPRMVAASSAANPCTGDKTFYEVFAPSYEGETWFTTNPPGCAQHAALKCRDRFGTTRWINPPWVVGVGVRSGANCPATWNPRQLNVDISPPTYGDVIYWYVDYKYP